MKIRMGAHFRLNIAAAVALPLFLTTLTASVTLAQGPGGSGGGLGRPGRPGMPPPFGGPRQASAVDVPIGMLEIGLSLTSDQKTKISVIQQQFQKQRQTMRPGPGGPGGPGGPDGRPGGQGHGEPDGRPGGPGEPSGPDGGPGGQGPGGGPMDKMRDLQQQTSKKIEALLTTNQKQMLPALLKMCDAMRATGIPAETYSDLKLTADQKTKIAAIAQKTQQTMRQNMDKARQGGGGIDFEAMQTAMQQARQQSHKEALDALSAEQRQTVDMYRKAHPRPEGGPGMPPPGDDQGPPPPPSGE